jgi:hypothetical protein
MTRKGWLWFGSIQAVGICCTFISSASFMHYLGGFLLLPGSLLPLGLEMTSTRAPMGIVLVGAIIVNALSWRSTAKILAG